jgi:4-alpha-glucanotransferase
MKRRSSGILMHISSLPGPYGIGDFGKGAYDFVDFLECASQKEWQILPLGITGFGDSPYQNFSVFAGNPYFIDLEEFFQKGYLNKEDIALHPLGDNPERVDYGLLYKNKTALLRIAYKRAKKEINRELEAFYEKEKTWLRDFALFMAIKKAHNDVSWLKWPQEYRNINSRAVLDFERENQDEIYFHIFVQYFFFKQWKALKNYANKKNIRIIGDIPIYVAEDSADLWRHHGLFKVDENLYPLTVAGCPPDAYSETGQLWGNPVYDWEAMERDGYTWWIDRIRASFEMYDMVRIDHFRGFEAYWEVKYGSSDAVNGKWTKGPGYKFFERIKDELGELPIIAEDLGFLTDEVYELIGKTGFPGMKVLQFAFESGAESEHLPHNYTRNCVVYTGTHDNNTIIGWVKKAGKRELLFARDYLKLSFEEGFNWGFIRGAFSSTADTCIIPMQDYLGLGDEARMNTPSTLGNNWVWRMKEDALTDELAEKIAKLTRIYGR